jgi:hypothetical protein
MTKCDCERGGSFPIFGEGFSRRQFLKIAGTTIVASYFVDVTSPRLLADVTSLGVPLQGNARNCIFIFLSGGPSQIDTWDLKEGVWTPKEFTPASYGDLRFPQGLMPNTANHVDKLAIVRSGLSWAAVHPLAQSWAQIARNPAGATGRIAPHIGAVVSLESQKTRTDSEILPGFVSLGGTTLAKSGYLPAQYAPLNVQPSANGLSSLTHPDGAARLADRWNLLQTIDTDRTSGELGKDATDMGSFEAQAKRLVDSPNVNKLFSFTADEHTRYGTSSFGDSCVVARNLLNSCLGTRFVQITLPGWDHHSNIYGKSGSSLFTMMKIFDPAYGSLLADLSTMAGATPGKSLLDETLIVVLGEFGRTVGAPGSQGGRDHFLRMSIAFAGGGVRGGRVVGQTDAAGTTVTDYGWSKNRDVRPEDVTSTIYSSLGIDYTTVRHDDPLNRGFEYVPFAKDGKYRDIAELF